MAENPLTQSQSPANNIDDIIEVIHNNDYAETDMSSFAAGTQSETNYSTTSSAMLKSDPDYAQKRKAYIKIIEQPQPKALRFRYVCEGRSAGAIPGVSSTAENKTHPAIKIMNFKGPVSVVVSCVTVEPPYRPHPHSLVGRECNQGVCTIEFQNEQMEYEFTNLGIQCIKKKDVGDALRLREKIKVDPFMTGFSHRNQPQHIDFNAVRLCFQVYLRDPNKRQSLFPLKPVVTEAIYDKKATADLIICKLSDCTSSVAGGKEIILLCDKVNKEDIKVRFFEIRDDRLAWESMADFQPSDVHKQVAISFKTPKYDNLNVENPVNVFLQLYRPSDHTRSEPRPFEYLPLDSVSHVKRKRGLESACNMKYIYKYVEENSSYEPSTGAVPRPIIHANRPSRTSAENMIKVEPRDPLTLSPPTDAVLGGSKMTRATISPRITGGGMYHVSSSPSPTQILPHIATPSDAQFYMPQSPNQIEIHMSPEGEVYQPAQSPYPMGVSQGATLIPHYISDHLHSPNATMPPQFDNTRVPTTQVYAMHHHPDMIHQYSNIDTMKAEDLFGMSGMDSDLRIPTGELLPLSQSFNAEMIDKDLSENFSNRMNILEPSSEAMGVNPLDKKTNEDMRVACSFNIPSTSQMDSSSTLSGILENVLSNNSRDELTPTQSYDNRIEELCSAADSPSLKSLASELRSLKQAAERKS